MRRCLAGAIAVAVMLAVTACGGGDGGDARPTESATGTQPAATAAPDPREDEREIREVAGRFYEAFLGMDGDAACSLMSKAAQRQLLEDPDNEGYGDTCPEILVGGAAVITAFSGSNPAISVTDEVAGGRATAVSTFANEREQLAFEREDRTDIEDPADEPAYQLQANETGLTERASSARSPEARPRTPAPAGRRPARPRPRGPPPRRAC